MPAGEDLAAGAGDRVPETGPPSHPQASQPGTRGTPLTLRRAYEFHQWFASTFQHRLGVRYRTSFQALMLAVARNVKNVVETGTVRLPGNWEFDGQSTRVFGAFAQRYGCKLWTCDIAQSHIAAARDLTAPFAQHIEYVVSDSVEFLQGFQEPIDFLYLDALDFDTRAPEVAQGHALREGQAALHALHDLSIVLIDDCRLAHGGKGGALVPFLLSRGWQVVRSSYQVLLTRAVAPGP